MQYKGFIFDTEHFDSSAVELCSLIVEVAEGNKTILKHHIRLGFPPWEVEIKWTEVEINIYFLSSSVLIEFKLSIKPIEQKTRLMHN